MQPGRIMKLRTKTELAATLGLLAITPFLFAQEARPTLPSDILGPQLIAWSQQQKPQPVPEPLLNSPDVRTFTGTIVKVHNRYVLQISSDVYQLDGQETARTFEGKEVKLTGALDESTRWIHVTSVRLNS
jgi:hypothetical protein